MHNLPMYPFLPIYSQLNVNIFLLLNPTLRDLDGFARNPPTLRLAKMLQILSGSGREERQNLSYLQTCFKFQYSHLL
jgi:hypothetical protein